MGCGAGLMTAVLEINLQPGCNIPVSYYTSHSKRNASLEACRGPH